MNRITKFLKQESLRKTEDPVLNLGVLATQQKTIDPEVERSFANSFFRWLDSRGAPTDLLV